MVKYLQQLLVSLGYDTTIDGIFSIDTEMSVKKFQTDTKTLTADGIVGSYTWKMIFKKYKVNVPGIDIEKMVNVAKHELTWRFKENNKNNLTLYGAWYGMNDHAWCAMFVSRCAMQADLLSEKVPRFAYCPSGVEWYRKRKNFI